MGLAQVSLVKPTIMNYGFETTDGDRMIEDNNYNNGFVHIIGLRMIHNFYCNLGPIIIF
jgi:hypothetical protein